MLVMSAKSKDIFWDERSNIRTNKVAKAALEGAKFRLRQSGRLLFRGRKITEEALASALWLWAYSQDTETLERELAVHVARLDAMSTEAKTDVPETEKGKGREANFIVRSEEDIGSGAGREVPARAGRKRKSS